MKERLLSDHRRRLVLSAALIVLGAPVAVASGPTAAPIFPNMAHSVGADPVAVAIGDVDGDGRRDLVVANRWSEDLSVLLGRGDGDFAPERRFDATGIPVAVAVADFNGDGRDDVAFALPVDDRVVIDMAEAAGVLVPSLTLAVGDSPSALLAADLDGDGAVDLAVADYFSDDVLVFAGRGDGTFAAARAFAVGNRPTALVLGLFDADLHADLAVANEGSGDVSVLLGDGTGGFRQGGAFSTWALGWSAAPRRLVAADFDGDGALDLVAGNFDNYEELNSLVLLPGRGDGTFAAGRFVARAPDGPLALVAADFNRDGRPDLAFGAHHGATCCYLRDGTIVLGRGDFGFDPGGAYRSGVGPVAVAAGFFDGDADIDLAVISDAYWDEVAINVGRGDGTMGRAPEVLDPGGGAGDVALGDVDGDGRPDIVSLDPYTGRLGVLRSEGGGHFAAPLTRAIGRSVRSFALGDFNGDGLDDVAILDAVVDEIALFTSSGAGLFRDPIVIRPGLDLRAIAAAEVTGDGIEDLLVASGDGGVVILLDAPGNGTHSPLRLPAGSDHPHALLAADVNGDGLPDIVVAGETLAVLAGIAPGQFEPPRVVATEIEYLPLLTAGDLNHDGRADIAVARSGGVLVFTGRADGGLDPGADVDLPAYPAALALADIDADGIPDLLALDDVSENADLSIVAGGANLPTRVGRRLLLGSIGKGLAAADLDGDGRTDLLVRDRDLQLVLITNQGPFRNRAPRALPRAAATVECSSPLGADVVLDGRDSSDPDSTPGTQDDLADFSWYEGDAPPTGRLLAQGSVAPVVLPLGTHPLTLVVTDRSGATAAQGFVIAVVDTTDPVVTARVSPGSLGAPNHRMVAVHADVSAGDQCGPVIVTLLSVTSSEPDDAPGAGDGASVDDIQGAVVGTADFDLLLRAERDGGGPGRVYTLTYRVTDGVGNESVAAAQVLVPSNAAAHRPGGGPGATGSGRPRANSGKRSSPLAP